MGEFIKFPKQFPAPLILIGSHSGVTAYQNQRGWELLGKLDELAHEHQTTLSAISLAWLRAQPTVAAPIASARNLDQLKEIMPLISLTEEELGRLT